MPDDPAITRPASTVPFRRVALVVHPTRDVDGALATLRRWTAEQDLGLVSLVTDGGRRGVAPAEEPEGGDLVVALGGDGTVLAALRAGASVRSPVLGVACGSVGALSAVTASELEPALHRLQAGDWTPRSLPALAIASDAGDEWAINDFVVVRGGPGQVGADVAVDGELYARIAGDGLIVATPLGSTAYSMAAGGAVLASGTQAFLCTPLAAHGGSVPPLVVPAGTTLTVDVEPGYPGFEIEVDGRRRPPRASCYRITLVPDRVALVALTPPGPGLAALRARGLIADSPRMVVRGRRAPS